MKAKIYLCKEISSAHWLKDYKGKCASLHGHNYFIEVFLHGEIMEDGMVADFSKVKSIIEEYDHVLLNKFLEQPTAENIAKELARKIKNELNENGRKIEVVKVRVWEDRDSYVEVEV